MTTPPQPEPEALLAHTNYVRALARELVFDSAQARDLEQETWLAALEQAPRDPAAQRGWLASVVRNLARRAWRSAGNRRARETDHARLERHVPTPDEVLAREDLRRVVVEAVNALEEPYRAALVLRWLEGHDPREVARRLGVPLESVKTRLKRGLELLRARLDRTNRGDRAAWCLAIVRGFGLGPPSFVKLLVVASSAALGGAFGVSLMSLAKHTAWMAALLAGGFTLVRSVLPEPSRDERAEPVTIAPVEAGAPHAEGALVATSATTEARAPLGVGLPQAAQDADLIEVRGRVLGPDGKPFAGAEVQLTRWHYDERYPKDPLAVGRSDEQGGFSLAYRKSDARFKVEAERPEMWRHVTAAAFAPGLGPDWQGLESLPEGKPLELRLVRDQPFRGRLLDLEGQPVAGVRVTVAGLGGTETGSLDAFLAHPKQTVPTKHLAFPPGHEVAAETDADGRFVLHGLGVERYTSLVFCGEQAAWGTISVVTRKYEAPGDLATDEMEPKRLGDGFEWVVRPTRAITGIVRDAKSGEPLADVTVGSQLMAGSNWMNKELKTRTDEHGRFRLVGMPKGAGNELLVIPNDQQPYFMSEIEVPDPAGMAPIELEIKLTRGLWITGRVTHKHTGEPVYGRLHYLPFLENKAAQEAFGLIGGIPRVPGGMLAQHHYKTDAEGNFRLVGLPGPALVGVLAIGSYRMGAGARELPELDEHGDLPTFESPINASVRWPTSMRRIDPAPGTTSLVCDLQVDNGQELEVELVDADGKPVENCVVRGSGGRASYTDVLDAGPKVAIQNIGPGEERLLRIHQPERCLGLVAKVTLEKGPKRLTLVPCTTISGRLIDEAGAPIGGVEVQIETGIDFDSNTMTKTDEAGRFRIAHVAPGVEYRISGRSEKLLDEYRLLVENPALPGGALDLGELVVPLR